MDPIAIAHQKPTTRLQATLLNLFAVLMVCAAGVLGWYLSNRSQGGGRHHYDNDPLLQATQDSSLDFSRWGQIFGYLCAVFYLASRVPQMLLNYRRKSTDGVSMLFFLFACIGNLTYVLSIFAYEPHCSGRHGKCVSGEMSSLYGRYILVNASWLVGSMGTLVLDLAIFIQFFLYRDGDRVGDEVHSEAMTPPETDQRPLLQREDSLHS